MPHPKIFDSKRSYKHASLLSKIINYSSKNAIFQEWAKLMVPRQSNNGQFGKWQLANKEKGVNQRTLIRGEALYC